MIGKWRSLAAGTALVGAGCVAYGTFVEAQAFVVRHADIEVLPPGHEPLRLLHVSDIHLLGWQSAKRRFLAALAALEPDFVINTGDNHADRGMIEPLESSIAGLLELPGAFVFGSNDLTGPSRKTPLSYFTTNVRGREGGELDHEGLHQMLTSHGWLDAMNQRHVVTVKGTTIELRGTGDAHIGRDRYGEVAGPASAGVDVSLGITHAPYRRVLDAMAGDDVDLLLAGHSHGGQVCVPFYGALISNCDLPPSMARGLHTWEHDGHRMPIHVSAGLGTSPYAPFRFACRPEVTLITLRPRA